MSPEQLKTANFHRSNWYVLDKKYLQKIYAAAPKTFLHLITCGLQQLPIVCMEVAKLSANS